MGGIDTEKSSISLLALKIVNQNTIPGRITKISATIKHLSYTIVVTPSTTPIDWPLLSVQITDGSQRMTDYKKLQCRCPSQLQLQIRYLCIYMSETSVTLLS